MILPVFSRKPVDPPPPPSPPKPIWLEDRHAVPVVTSDDLLIAHNELIDKITAYGCLSKTTFEKRLLPIFCRFAEWVGALPASQGHHHNRLGGLFEHSIDVAQLSGRTVKGINPTNYRENRNNIVEKWVLTSIVAGLIHDIGKTMTDITVISPCGNKFWEPLTESILDWSRRTGSDHYYVEWRLGRGKRHEEKRHSMLQPIVGRQFIESIADPEILTLLTASRETAPSSDAQRAFDAVVRADRSSVAADLRTCLVKWTPFEFGSRVAKNVIIACRRLIDDGTWKVNDPDGQVFILNHDGSPRVFIAWRRAFSILTKFFDDNQIPGIPDRSDVILQVLSETHVIIPAEKDDCPSPMWKIWPDIWLGGLLSAILFVSSDYLFEMMPQAIPGRVMTSDSQFNLLPGQTPVQSIPEAPPARTEDSKEDDLTKCRHCGIPAVTRGVCSNCTFQQEVASAEGPPSATI